MPWTPTATPPSPCAWTAARRAWCGRRRWRGAGRPATVKKHLERIYEKLGVETRTAAAAMAMQRVRELNAA